MSKLPDILNWVDESVQVDNDIFDGRDKVASHISSDDLSYLCRRSLGFGLGGLENLFAILKKRFEIQLCGTGIELGAGAGFLTSQALVTYEAIEKIFAVELSEKHVTRVMTKVANEYAFGHLTKYQRVVGSFDALKIEDSSLDFAIEINSLHHSFDLQRTFEEVARVLRDGGLLICIDRSHPDFVTDMDIEEMLNRKYSSASLKQIGLSNSQVVTRRDNGEHEYRDREWKEIASKAGFQTMHFEKIGSVIQVGKIIRGLVARSPVLLRKLLVTLIPGLKKYLLNERYVPRDGELRFQFSKLTRKSISFERELTIMIFKKARTGYEIE